MAVEVPVSSPSSCEGERSLESLRERARNPPPERTAQISQRFRPIPCSAGKSLPIATCSLRIVQMCRLGLISAATVRLAPFIRVNSTNRKSAAVQIREMKNLNRIGSFDEQVIPDLKSEAIVFRADSELLATYR